MQEKNEQCDCCCKPIWLYALMGLGVIVLSAYLIVLIRNNWRQYDYIGKTAESTHTLNITGEGKVLAIPDIATVSLGLQTEKPQVAVAQKENTVKMNSLYDALKNLSIDKKDITTTQYNVYPEYNWTQQKGQILKGYIVSQNVNVKIRDFNKIPNVLELISTLNLNQVGGLTFSVDEPEKLQQEARIKAIKNAKEKADALAKEAGVKLGRIVSFSESYNDVYPRPMYTKEMATGIGGGGAVPSPNVEPGSQEIMMQINISYEIL